jgi:hypothetical protein
MLFATFRTFIPQPRPPHQPRRYVGRHREPEPVQLVPEIEGLEEMREPEPHAA